MDMAWIPGYVLTVESLMVFDLGKMCAKHVCIRVGGFGYYGKSTTVSHRGEDGSRYHHHPTRLDYLLGTVHQSVQ